MPPRTPPPFARLPFPSLLLLVAAGCAVSTDSAPVGSADGLEAHLASADTASATAKEDSHVIPHRPRGDGWYFWHGHWHRHGHGAGSGHHGGHHGGTAGVWFKDNDGDTFGDPKQKKAAKTQPKGYVADDSDCDDSRALTNPDASETCNGIDDDCTGDIDEDYAIDAVVQYADVDGDGAGDPSWAEASCSLLDGFVPTATDCDDDDAAVHVGATEVCNGVDDDCDGATDDWRAVDAPYWYMDGDADGYGTDGLPARACTRPAGYSSSDADCDDTSGSIHPGATETCNGADDDCDGSVDEAGATGGSTFYADADADGYGTKASSTTACAAPKGYVTNATDCDDAHAAAHPGGTEVCDGLDDNCDGKVDDWRAVDAPYWYMDQDADGYGSPELPARACTQPAGYSPSDADCDDTQDGVHPGATEVCDGQDDDCDGTVDDPDTVPWTTWYADVDADGFGDADVSLVSCELPSDYVDVAGDCDDTDGAVSPAAVELCNGVDDDCDGLVDNDAADALSWYADVDGDGFGDDSTELVSCVGPDDAVTVGGDCDDDAPDANPDGVETCNGADDDCDGSVDEDNCDGVPWYADADGDGYGDAAVVRVAVDQPDGFVAIAGDCDDTSAVAHPDADEVCDGLDDDCDGAVDEDATDAAWFYADADGDGHGDASGVLAGCVAPEGYVDVADDCDDTNAGVNPDATEVCDGVDDDCDGVTDDDAIDRATWYPDLDADGFGDGEAAFTACGSPADAVAEAGDCDDADSAVNPAAIELCDGLDDDCDGEVDEASAADALSWYGDTDGDGYGDAAATTIACEAPAGAVADATDCDDASADVHPGAVEACNGVDDDCDSEIDEEGAQGEATWFADTDGDGYGDPASSVTACTAPTGYVENADDCDDTHAEAFTGAVEVCDDVDNDCDGQTDEADAVDAVDFYVDIDGDGHGSAATPTRACTAPDGYAAAGDDCDDHDAAAFPGNTEVCDGIDDDCNGTVDGDEAIDAIPLQADADLDGHGDPATTIMGCAGTEGLVADFSDCDDTHDSVYPGAPERCDGLDNDCNGEVDVDAIDARLFYVDADADGYGVDDGAIEACKLPEGYAARTGDCDDATATTNPLGVEVCNGADDNCDGAVDVGAVDAPTWYTDADGDGHGVEGTDVAACTAPEGTAALDDDCDDAAASVNPAQTEICDGVDDDCDGTVDVNAEGAPTWYRDGDGDGYGFHALVACDAPEGYVDNDLDCNDHDADAHPDAGETCNGKDDDCDGDIDEVADIPYTPWYRDDDGDGFGDPAVAESACAAPDGYVEDATDCDDRLDVSHPGATELCDGKDNDCDGEVDDPDTVPYVTWYADTDGDRYGDPENTTSACAKPHGYVADSADCDDTDDTINPVGVEQCDGLDNNCDGQVDELEGTGISQLYADTDGDGHGDPDVAIPSCVPVDGYSELDDDCDDDDDAVNPDADELCNAIDDDCDGEVDEATPVDAPAWYADLDGDAAGGTDADIVWACDAPDGYSADNDDCDDTTASVGPAVDEVCNSIDDDCNGRVDEDSAVDAAVWHADSDGDGFGGTKTRAACVVPDGYTDDDSDCDDRSADVFPGAAEVCNDLDDDCDGAIDDDTTIGAHTVYADTDGDSYGDAATGELVCSTPDGFVEDGEDCNDTDGAVHPNAAEVCNGIDDNCDGSTDGSDASGQSTWYLDADHDGYGDGHSTVRGCTAPVGYLADADDCDDAHAAVNPDGVEVCGNGYDDDCDGGDERCGPFGVRSAGTADAIFEGAASGDELGTSVAMVPDLDGDGKDDIVVGAIGLDAGASEGGGAYVFGATPSGHLTAGTAIGRLTGETANGLAGRSIAGLGDVDGDGYGDLAIGAYTAGFTGVEAGAAYIVHGPIYGDTPLAGAETRILGDLPGDWAGYAVSGIGDQTGDGLDDLLVGAPYEDAAGSRAGATYVVSGARTGDVRLSTATAKLTGEASLDRSATAVADAGDVDGDGVDDLLVGAWGNSATGRNAGAAYVVYGPVAGTFGLALADVRLQGQVRGDQTGIGVAGAGDIDGDGLDDVLVGADGVGVSYLVETMPAGTAPIATAAAATMTGEDLHGHAGWAVSAGGDVDADGHADMLIGAYNQTVGSGTAGTTYIVLGPVSGTVTLTRADGRLRGVTDLDMTGYSVAGGGDLDGDGFSDVLFGGWGADPHGSASGAAYLFYGGSR